jgi:hypothetical protein
VGTLTRHAYRVTDEQRHYRNQNSRIWRQRRRGAAEWGLTTDEIATKSTGPGPIRADGLLVFSEVGLRGSGPDGG